MGGGVPSLNNASSEYLVDTENNKIIYPYTKAENIIGLESFSPGNPGEQPSIPPITGGADKDSYFELSTTAFTRVSGNNRYLFEHVPISPGIWTLNTHLAQAAGGISPNNAAILSLYVAEMNLSSACWLPYYADFAHFACNLLVRVTKESTITVVANSPIAFKNFTCTLNGIKLTDL